MQYKYILSINSKTISDEDIQILQNMLLGFIIKENPKLKEQIDSIISEKFENIDGNEKIEIKKKMNDFIELDEGENV